MTLKGIGASPGIAEGIVKIVHGAKDAPLFEEGQILVAEMTEPSMVILMNKAGAIITDRGGLTSHPAIVSRELGCRAWFRPRTEHDCSKTACEFVSTEPLARSPRSNNMENHTYPTWIDEYAISIQHAFSNMVPSSWSSIDGFAVMTELNGTFLSKLAEAIRRLKEHDVPIETVAHSFSCLSSLRAAFMYVATEYQQSKSKDRAQAREIVEYLVTIIQHLAKADPFAFTSNVIHSMEEITTILNETPWSAGTPVIARELGKLYTSLASLVFAQYRDFFPQDSHEIYGPYSAEEKYGSGTILLMKQFPKIRPVELWPETASASYREVKIFQIYRDVAFKCELVGMHSLYQGDLMHGLVAYAVEVDGKIENDPAKIKELSTYFAEAATVQSSLYESLSNEQCARKFLEWECYQFINFFRFAEMDWQPSEAMLEAIRGKEIPIGLKIDTFPSLEDFLSNPLYEVYWLKDLYT